MTKLNDRSVNVSWALESCWGDTTPTYVYIMYIRASITDKDEEWQIHGEYANVTHTVVDYLWPGITYKAYMVQANKHGNGPPSQRFYMTSVASRELFSVILKFSM